MGFEPGHQDGAQGGRRDRNGRLPCKCLCKCAEEIRAILGEKRKNENSRKSLNQKDEMIVGRSGQNSPRRTRKPLNLQWMAPDTAPAGKSTPGSRRSDDHVRDLLRRSCSLVPAINHRAPPPSGPSAVSDGGQPVVTADHTGESVSRLWCAKLNWWTKPCAKNF